MRFPPKVSIVECCLLHKPQKCGHCEHFGGFDFALSQKGTEIRFFLVRVTITNGRGRKRVWSHQKKLKTGPGLFLRV